MPEAGRRISPVFSAFSSFLRALRVASLSAFIFLRFFSAVLRDVWIRSLVATNLARSRNFPPGQLRHELPIRRQKIQLG